MSTEGEKESLELKEGTVKPMKVLGVDYGDVRTGLAVSDGLGLTAQGLDTLLERNMKSVAKRIIEVAEDKGVCEIVIGYPKNMNGSVGARGEKTKKLVKLLKAITDLPIILWDERLTTVYAHNIMNETNLRGKKRKNEVDRLAAAVILQEYLDGRKKR